ncbi:MAG: LacI family transcriptional regulator [Propionibacteriaceae bacterium]|nr:LacI family transcriptional regulator [Propionibacteriaceae bacterium]
MPTRINQRPTQRQIAAQVGVSVTTVSRILNPDESHPERWASPETVAAIQQAAAQLGYRHNALAVSLRTSRSQTVGVLLPVVGDFVTASIYSGIDDVAREHGMTALTASTLDEPVLRAERTFSLLDHLVDGIIFADAHLDEDFLDSVATQAVPFTLVHRRHPDHVCVTADDVAAGRLAAQHFIDLGRRRMAVISGPRFMSTGVDRAQGFVDAIVEAGLPAPTVFDSALNVKSGGDATRAMLASSHFPDAIFAVHDGAALGVLSVLRHEGLSVPDDVAVIGFYDTPMSSAMELTSINVDLNNMGRRALELLLARLSDQQIESEVCPVTLTVRRSTDPSLPPGGHGPTAEPLTSTVQRAPHPAESSPQHVNPAP